MQSDGFFNTVSLLTLTVFAFMLPNIPKMAVSSNVRVSFT